MTARRGTGFPGHTTEDAGEFRLSDRPWRLPLTFTLQAERPADVALEGYGYMSRVKSHAA